MTSRADAHQEHPYIQTLSAFSAAAKMHFCNFSFRNFLESKIRMLYVMPRILYPDIVRLQQDRI